PWKTNYVFPPFPQPLLLLINQDEKAATQKQLRSFTQNPLRIPRLHRNRCAFHINPPFAVSANGTVGQDHADELLYQSLPGHLESLRGLIDLIEHCLTKINSRAAKWRHHLAFVCKVGRYVFALVRFASEGFSGRRSGCARGFLHKAFLLLQR
ncbi:MAG: hypothetical protein ACT4OT_18285, partial [Acidobacteriota bacterium]